MSRRSRSSGASSIAAKLTDIFAVEEEISREISGKLRLRLSGEEKKRLVKRYTENTEAYHLYLKGRYYTNKRTEEWIKKGIEYFQQATDLDPNYALAYAGLADAYAFLASSTGGMPPRRHLPESEGRCARKLLRLTMRSPKLIPRSDSST